MQNSRKVQMNNLRMLFNNEELFAGGKDWALLILRGPGQFSIDAKIDK